MQDHLNNDGEKKASFNIKASNKHRNCPKVIVTDN